jgi:hypothetical protein
VKTPSPTPGTVRAAKCPAAKENSSSGKRTKVLIFGVSSLISVIRAGFGRKGLFIPGK